MIIGVMGQARAGKDTLADYLVVKYGFVRIALADPIKRSIRDWYGLSHAQLWGDDKEKPDFRFPLPDGGGHLTGRKAAQVVGTEVGRQAWPDTWVYRMKEDAKLVLAGTHVYDKQTGAVPKSLLSRIFGKKVTGVVVSDVRFRNEVDSIQMHPNGFVVRVKRVVATGAVGIAGHQSEEEQKTIPDQILGHVIENNGSLEEYYKAIDKMMVKVPAGTTRLRRVA